MTAFNLLGPYRGRSSIEFARLHGHALALLNHASDHLWSLREDPSYFMELITLGRWNNPIWVKNIDMEENPYLRDLVFSPAFGVDESKRIVQAAYWIVGLIQVLVKHLSVSIVTRPPLTTEPPWCMLI